MAKILCLKREDLGKNNFGERGYGWTDKPGVVLSSIANRMFPAELNYKGIGVSVVIMGGVTGRGSELWGWVLESDCGTDEHPVVRAAKRLAQIMGLSSLRVPATAHFEELNEILTFVFLAS